MSETAQQVANRVIDFISAPTAAFWAAMGGALAKVIDWLLSRRRRKRAEHRDAMSQISSAQKNFTDTILHSMSVMQESVEQIRRQGDDNSRELRELKDRVADMERRQDNG